MKSTNDMNEKPLVDKEYLLEKSSPGKGGWTFTIFPRFCRIRMLRSVG